MGTRVFGHRGAASLAPENSMAAISTAWEVGADGAEIDVQAAADGELVVFHDRCLNRTTNVAAIFPGRAGRPLTDFTAAELDRLECGSWFVRTDPFGTIEKKAVPDDRLRLLETAPIPRLAEVLAFVRERGWSVNLELKTYRGGAAAGFAALVIESIERARVRPGSVIISSFDHDLVREATRLRPRIEASALIDRHRLGSNQWRGYEFSSYTANARFIDPAQIEAARNNGCTVSLYTVNDVDDARRYRRWGVERLISDVPQLLVGRLG